ncbi:hypothetical protein [Actinoplanes sp. NPDC026619]|uniref:hypothetical protein n=1 Tax=Actinoplanes sp. NPDC026619 TaxID=3155798 RepID=UPI00340301E5
MQSRPVTVYPGRPAIDVRHGAGAPFGWWPAICVALVAAIDRVEYNLLAGALPTIQEEFGFSDSSDAVQRAGEAPATMRVQLAALLRIRTLRSVITGLSILFFGLGGLFFWMPSFYAREFGLPEAAPSARG